MVISRVLPTVVKLAKYDQKAWNKLYWGIRHDVSQGIRHGLFGGGIIGNLIDDNPLDESDGQIPQKPSSSKYRKARGRQTGRYRYRHQRKRRACSCQRQSNRRYSKRYSNR